MENKPKPGTYAYNKEYAKKWEAKQDSLRIRIPTGEKAVWQAAAARAGESVNQYVIKAVAPRMEKEKED